MKKILVMLMCLAMLLASCEKEQITNDAFSESSSLQESSSEESSSVDEPSPDIPPEPDTLGIKTTAKTVEEIKLDCYKELGVYIGSYTGEKPSEKNGDFYRIVDNYEDFEALATKAHFLDKKTFDDYNALILYRQYKKEHYAKIGVSNFKIENGKATMDRYVYTGSNFLEDMVEDDTLEDDTLEDESYISCDVDYYLVPKADGFKANDKLEPITLNKIEFNSYAVQVAKINGLQRDDVLVLTSYNELAEFRNKYNAHGIYFDRYYYGYEDDCFYIVLPQIVEKDIVAADAKLDGSTLKLNMIQMHDSYNYTNPKNAVIIEIPYTSKRYEREEIMDAEELTHDEILDAEEGTDEEVIVYFEQLPKDIKIELTVYDCDNRKYYPTLTEEEWDSAIDATISAENYTMQYEPNCRIGINGSIFQGRIIYKYTSGMYHESSHAQIVRHMGGKRTIVDSAHGMLVDYENNKTIITTGNTWTNADDGYVHDCHFKEIDISKFKGIFKGATLQKDGSYRVSQHGNRFNVKVIIANGRLHYLGFNTVPCEYGYDEHHAFYFYDYDNTEIIEPELGSTFEFKY